jgi:hypothetical protein
LTLPAGLPQLGETRRVASQANQLGRHLPRLVG